MYNYVQSITSTPTKEPYHSISSSSDEQVAVVIEGHAMDTDWEGLQRKGALC